MSLNGHSTYKQANEIARAYQTMLNILADIAEALEGETATTEELICIFTFFLFFFFSSYPITGDGGFFIKTLGAT